MTGLILHGFRQSVYVRVARLALYLRGLDYALHEIDPFADGAAAGNPHPMNRIPVLDHDGFRLFETRAILAYLDRAFPGEPLLPADPHKAARAMQVQGIVDAYGYWPMVRQVFVATAQAQATGRSRDGAMLAEGLAAAAPVLRMLEGIADEGHVLAGPGLTLADLHLAPMMAYFTVAPEGAAALAAHPALRRWWQGMRAHPAMAATDPGLPQPRKT